MLVYRRGSCERSRDEVGTVLGFSESGRGFVDELAELGVSL
jgi:hypothetical protein